MSEMISADEATEGHGVVALSKTLAAELELALEDYRAELKTYCYRWLGSAFEAEDAVQETMLRAWRNLDSFEGRCTLRSWVYRIASNVCLDMLNARRRRAHPIDLGPVHAESSFETHSEILSAETASQARTADPAEAAELHEAVRTAFVAALRYLTPKQRAVLILKDVLRWKATEVAELLGTSVASVNSALQRARSTLESKSGAAGAPDLTDGRQRTVVKRCVDAFARYDTSSLTSLLQ